MQPLSIKAFTSTSVLNYDSLKQRIIFTATVNVSGDLILQKIILKQVFFFIDRLCARCVDHIYIPCYFMLRILIKRLFWWKLFFSGVEGRINFPGG